MYSIEVVMNNKKRYMTKTEKNVNDLVEQFTSLQKEGIRFVYINIKSGLIFKRTRKVLIDINLISEIIYKNNQN